MEVSITVRVDVVLTAKAHLLTVSSVCLQTGIRPYNSFTSYVRATLQVSFAKVRADRINIGACDATRELIGTDY